VIRAEKRSGTSTAGRDELRTVLDLLRKGDVLTVTRIDRLTRASATCKTLCARWRHAGASLKATEQPLDRRERQLEGIARAKAEGVYKGRPASIDVAKVRAMKAGGMRATEIAKALKIGRHRRQP
jgi:DNA invertase Pin-like site-specific DNA recombinase